MLTRGDVSMIFDPFLTGNTWDIAKKEDIKCQYIFVSHGHDDHYGDTDFIAKTNDALVISTAEVAGKMCIRDRNKIYQLKLKQPSQRINGDVTS